MNKHAEFPPEGLQFRPIVIGSEYDPYSIKTEGDITYEFVSDKYTDYGTDRYTDR